MNSFRKCLDLEQQALLELSPFIQKASDGRFVFTHKGRLSALLQKTIGDIVINDKKGVTHGIEVKSEQSQRTGNFFLETWSNCKFGMQTPGWMWTLRADWLFYYFVDDKELYTIRFDRLWEWAFIRASEQGLRGRLRDFKERPQRKHAQLNETWGALVEIEVVGREVGFKKWRINGGDAQELTNGKSHDEPTPPAQVTQQLLFCDAEQPPMYRK